MTEEIKKKATNAKEKIAVATKKKATEKKTEKKTGTMTKGVLKKSEGLTKEELVLKLATDANYTADELCKVLEVL